MITFHNNSEYIGYIYGKIIKKDSIFKLNRFWYEYVAKYIKMFNYDEKILYVYSQIFNYVDCFEIEGEDCEEYDELFIYDIGGDGEIIYNYKLYTDMSEFYKDNFMKVIKNTDILLIKNTVNYTIGK